MNHEPAPPKTSNALALIGFEKSHMLIKVFKADEPIFEMNWQYNQLWSAAAQTQLMILIDEIRTNMNIEHITALPESDHLEEPLLRTQLLSKLRSVFSPLVFSEGVHRPQASLVARLFSRDRDATVVRYDRTEVSVSVEHYSANRNKHLNKVVFRIPQIGSAERRTLELPSLHKLAANTKDDRYWPNTDTEHEAISYQNENPDRELRVFRLALEEALWICEAIKSQETERNLGRRIILEEGVWSPETPGLVAMYRANDQVLLTPAHHTSQYEQALQRWPREPYLQPARIVPATYLENAWALQAKWVDGKVRKVASHRVSST